MQIEINCSWCIHLSTDTPGTCAAFPDGIPGEILAGKHPHMQTFEGDRGIRFKLAPEFHADVQVRSLLAKRAKL